MESVANRFFPAVASYLRYLMVGVIEENMLSIKVRSKQTTSFFLKGKTLASTKKAEVPSEPYQTSKKKFFRGVGMAAGSTSGLRLFGFCTCQSSKGFLPKYHALSNWI